MMLVRLAQQTDAESSGRERGLRSATVVSFTERTYG